MSELINDNYMINNGTLEICLSKDITEVKNIPANVDCIGKRAFYNQKNLTSVIIPNTVSVIQDLAFSNCENLIEITIPENVIVGENIFNDCTNIKKLTIGTESYYIKMADNNFITIESNENISERLMITKGRKILFKKSKISFGRPAFIAECYKILGYGESVREAKEECGLKILAKRNTEPFNKLDLDKITASLGIRTNSK